MDNEIDSTGVPDEIKNMINRMSQVEMARQVRFAPVGDKMFQGKSGKYFNEVFQNKGGMTPSISKLIGWSLRQE